MKMYNLFLIYSPETILYLSNSMECMREFYLDHRYGTKVCLLNILHYQKII